MRERATTVIYIVWNKTRAGEDYRREEVSFICVCVRARAREPLYPKAAEIKCYSAYV